MNGVIHYMQKIVKIIIVNNNAFIFIGDIHGLFREFVHEIVKKLNLTNYNIIICGDFGMGFHKPRYYNTEFKRINKLLRKNNIHIYAFRGNHDNPEYFYNEEILAIVMDGITNIHLVNDYDILKNDNHSIVCIGGARSVDKCQRWKWDHVTQTQIPYGWWESEMIKDIPEGFNEFITENNINIDIVCSHSSPDFCEPLSKSGLEFWAKYDETVIEDCDKERALLTSIYNRLKKTNNIQYWFYGHFHAHYYLIKDDVVFRGLNMFDGVYKTDYYILGDGSAFS